MLTHGFPMGKEEKPISEGKSGKAHKIDLLQKTTKSISILENPIVCLSVDGKHHIFQKISRLVCGLFAVHHYVLSSFDENSL